MKFTACRHLCSEGQSFARVVGSGHTSSQCACLLGRGEFINDRSHESAPIVEHYCLATKCAQSIDFAPRAGFKVDVLPPNLLQVNFLFLTACK
jgi:hypothetical protein